MPEWHERKWIIWAFVAAFVALALYIAVPNLPWVKPEILENGKVIKSEQGRCTVETESKWILTVSCSDKRVGDTVKVRYRTAAKIGDLAQ